MRRVGLFWYTESIKINRKGIDMYLKKIALIILGCTLLHGSFLAAQEEEQPAAKQLAKGILSIAGKYPLSYFRNALLTQINQHVNALSDQIGAKEIAVSFDEKKFYLIIDFLYLKLKMPSVTEQDKKQLLADIKIYLNEEDGTLHNIMIFFGTIQDAREDTAPILQTTQLIIDGLEKIKKEIKQA